MPLHSLPKGSRLFLYFVILLGSFHLIFTLLKLDYSNTRYPFCIVYSTCKHKDSVANWWNYYIYSDETSTSVPFYATWFFTEDYLEKSKRLEDSCRKLRIPYSPIELVFNKTAWGSEHSLLAIKPWFMQRRLLDLKRPILFMDSDLVFLKYPSIFTPEGSHDIDFMAINWYKDSDSSLLSSSGLSWWNTTEKAFTMLRVWQNALVCYSNQYAPDDQVFDGIFLNHKWHKRIHYQWLDVKKYLAMKNWNHRNAETVIDHPDSLHAHPGKRTRPKVPPQWLIESGKIFSPIEPILIINV
jgi:hypothetical protein